MQKYISKKKLKIGWYYGIGRNSLIAYYTGLTFLTIGKKFNQYEIKDEGLYEEGRCFMPIKFLAESKIENVHLKDLNKNMKEYDKLKRQYNYKQI